MHIGFVSQRDHAKQLRHTMMFQLFTTFAGMLSNPMLVSAVGPVRVPAVRVVVAVVATADRAVAADRGPAAIIATATTTKNAADLAVVHARHPHVAKDPKVHRAVRNYWATTTDLRSKLLLWCFLTRKWHSIFDKQPRLLILDLVRS